MAVDQVGSVFRGRTVTEEAAVSDHVSLVAVAGAQYCTDCGVLVVHEARHRQAAAPRWAQIPPCLVKLHGEN